MVVMVMMKKSGDGDDGDDEREGLDRKWAIKWSVVVVVAFLSLECSAGPPGRTEQNRTSQSERPEPRGRGFGGFARTDAI